MDAALKTEAGVETLQESIQEALWDYEPVRTSRRPLRVRVLPEGVVEVSGTVRTRLIQDTVLEILENHPGVHKVVSHLRADPDIELAVARKLAEDPRTASLPPGAVQIYSLHGVTTLVGRLPAGASPATVVEVVSELEAVRRVVDRLEIDEG